MSERNGKLLRFPEGFLWGTATSTTQVEDHIQNEWTDFTAQDGGNCRIACDHYYRYPEDIDWMSKLESTRIVSASSGRACNQRPLRRSMRPSLHAMLI